MNFRRMMAAAVVAAGGLWVAAAHAEETVVWWDFLGGGDGVRMKQLIADFNAAHAGKVKIDATTLEWGTPFYAKVQTSAAVGEAADIMTYHASRIPLAVSQDILEEITADDMSKMGLSASDFAPATWDAVTVDGKQYAVPLDTHPIVLYYNRDLLKKAGVLGDDGRPMGMGSKDGLHRHAAEAEGRRRRVPAGQRHRRRQLHVPHHLFADVPAGRRAADRR